MQPLLDSRGAELDRFTRHPAILPVVDRLLGGEACFTQFDFRQSPGTCLAERAWNVIFTTVECPSTFYHHIVLP